MFQPLSRLILPLLDPDHADLTPYGARDSDTLAGLRPPVSAPNVLIVLIEDGGFGASSAFGGPCYTPTFERLARNGLRYNRFHTTGLPLATRQALLTGRNPTGGSVTDDKAAIAEVLRLNGYLTARFGRGDGALGPEGNPAGSGFEHVCDPAGGSSEVAEPSSPLTGDLADRAIAWVSRQREVSGDKPFFMFFAPGALASHHVVGEWSDRYAGRFDGGWDSLRVETFERQKTLGVIPPEAQLTVRPAGIPAWEEIDDAVKPVLARQMEVRAGCLGEVDYHVGRLIDSLEELGMVDDTLVYILVGDNGAAVDGAVSGGFSEVSVVDGLTGIEATEFLVSKVDELGMSKDYCQAPAGWTYALCTPYQWMPQASAHWGGTRNGAIVHWPRGIKAGGGIRSQFHHVIDIARTILAVAGLPEPAIVNSIAQAPFDGVSMLPGFDDANPDETHDVQHFAMTASRGIYHQGWSACTRHRASRSPATSADNDLWELYAPDDWTQTHNLADEEPERLAGLQEVWRIEAAKYSGLPIDERPADPARSDISLHMKFTYSGVGMARTGT